MSKLASLAASLLLACVAASNVNVVEPPKSTLFYEGFANGMGAFSLSEAVEYASQTVVVGPPTRHGGVPSDGIVLQKAAQKYAVTAPFSKPVDTSEGLVVQYEVKTQEGLTCGGAYVKLLNATKSFQAKRVDNNTPYAIMFGPDKCGNTDKVHFIIRWKNPVTGKVEEKHLDKAPRTKGDSNTHLYTLIIRKDDTYAIKIDNEVAKSGSLASDFAPAILEPRQIDDPTDIKPSDWVDTAEISDPKATKPDDWDENAPAMVPDEDAVKPEGWLDDEPLMVPDPEAEKPESWDDEEDGEYVAPMVENPRCKEGPGCGEWKRPMKRNSAYKGKWTAPKIPNPEYKGEWKARQIENPGYFEDEHLHLLSGAKMAGIAVEVWTMNAGLFFDNFLVATDEHEAADFAAKTWGAKHAAEVAEQDAETRAAAKKAREEAFESGSVLDKVGYYLAEAWDIALYNPIPSIITATVLFISLIGSCYYCMASDEEKHVHPLPSQRAAPETADEESEKEEIDQRFATKAAEAAPSSSKSQRATGDAAEAAPSSSKRRNSPAPPKSASETKAVASATKAEAPQPSSGDAEPSTPKKVGAEAGLEETATEVFSPDVSLETEGGETGGARKRAKGRRTQA